MPWREVGPGVQRHSPAPRGGGQEGGAPWRLWGKGFGWQWRSVSMRQWLCILQSSHLEVKEEGRQEDEPTHNK